MSYREQFKYDVTKLLELSKRDPSLITIEATVVTGFETMAMEECQEKCKPVNICKAKGRIYFNIPIDDFSKVLKMRAVDNVFLINEAFGKIDFEKVKEKDFELIQSLVDRVDWKTSLSVWSKLTEFEGILFPPLKGTVEQLAVDLAKTVLDEENENLSKQNVDNSNVPGNEVIADSELNNILEIKGDTVCDNKPRIDANAAPSTVIHEEALSKRRGSSSSDASFYSMEEADFLTDEESEKKKNLTLEENLKNKAEPNKPVAKSNQETIKGKKGGDKKDVDPNILKFRATCNRVGDHSFSSMEAAALFGGTLNDKFNWTVNLDNFDLNVILNINKDSCYICSAITPKSLHRRNITHFGYTTLRSTMCYSMVRLAQPTEGEIVIDPLCGGGSIPIEGALGFPYTYHICGDNNDKAMNRTLANINHITKTQSLLVDPLKWSAKHLPLRDQSIDIFVTDLPFGKRSGKRSDNLGLYKKVLTELARVTRCGTGRAVVLTNDKTSLTRALGGNNGVLWRQVSSFGVNQGGLFSTVFLLIRTAKPFFL